MKLQAASKRETLRIAFGSAICLAIMLAVFFVLSLLGILKLENYYKVVLGGIGGTLVAILNFVILCLTIQKVAGMENGKPLKTRVQLSYNLRLVLQAIWVIVAFIVPCFNVLAAAIPLLFPTAVLYTLQIRGKLAVPSERRDTPSEPEETEERLDTFEV